MQGFALQDAKGWVEGQIHYIQSNLCSHVAKMTVKSTLAVLNEHADLFTAVEEGRLSSLRSIIATFSESNS